MRRDISSFGRPGHLPFSDKEDEFISTVENNNYTILYGPTGSGKTLRATPALIKAFPWMRVAVTQLHRNAVTSLSKRMAFEQGWRLGGKVGFYLARARSFLSRETRIVFQVDNSLVNRVLEDEELSQYDAVFLDEQHLRTIPIDILQGSLDSIVEKRPDFKVIVSTATPDLAKLQKYFAQFGSVGVVRVEGRPSEVKTRWAYMKRGEHHLSAVKRWMNVLIEEATKGKVAVFLPGVEEINKIIDFVDSLNRQDIDALPCHGKLDDEEQNRIYEPVDDNRLRFIVSTEIIETSITVPDLVGGIDSMEVFREVTTWAGLSKYVKRHIAKDAAIQRMGRFGRIKGVEGFYMPIIGWQNEKSSQEEWNRLPEHTLPQILETDLEKAVLIVEAMGIAFNEFPWMDRPSEKAYKNTVANLQRLGALNGDGRITEEGKIYARMPFSAGLSKAYFKAQELGVSEHVKIGASVLAENDSLFWVPGRGRKLELTPAMEALLPDKAKKSVKTEKKFRQKKGKSEEIDIHYLPGEAIWNGQRLAKFHRDNFADGSNSDIIASINAYLGWLANGRDSKWARAKMLKPRSLWRVLNNIKDINQALWEAGMNGNNNKKNEEKVINAKKVVRALAAGMVNNLAIHEERNNYKGLLYNLIVSSSSALNNVDEWPDLVLFSHVTLAEGIGSGGSNLRFAQILSEVNAEDILKDNPQLCKIKYDNYTYDADKDVVLADEHLWYVKTEIRVQEQVVCREGEAVFAELGRALVSGKVEYPFKKENDALIAEANDLNNRFQGSLCPRIKEKVENLFKDRLMSAQAYSLSKAVKLGVDFRIKEQDIEKLFNIDSLQELRERAERERPKIWNIREKEYPLEYSTEWWFTGAKIQIPVEVARDLKPAELPDFGEKCEIRVYLKDKEYSDLYVLAKEAETLVNKIERHRLNLAWSKKRSELEHTSWISDPEKVLSYLPKLLTAVEITRTNNGEGEPIFGYFSLYSDSHPDFQIRIRESREEAEEETKIGLERLLKKSCYKILVIPKEDPWQKSGWSWEITDLGRALQSRFETLFKEHAENLTPHNIGEKVSAIKVAAEEARAQILGNHESIKQLIEEAEAEVNGKINTVDDSRLVESEIEQVREAIEKAKKSLKSAAYEEVKVACEKAIEVASKLSETYNARLRAKQETEDFQEKISDELYNIEYDEEFKEIMFKGRSKASKLGREISEAFSDHRYEVVVEKVKEARQFIARVRECEEILRTEYAVCPVCGRELYRGETHYCSREGQGALMARGEYSELKVKVSKISDQELISLIADYDSSENEFEMRLEVNGQLLAEFPDAEIKTESAWREPTPRERELASEIFELRHELARIEEERERGGRVEVVLSEGRDPKGNPQLRAEGIFTGMVENRHEESGWSEYENQSAIFVSRIPCHWLETQPKAGETWICVLKFQIAKNGQKPVIVVYPQVRSDSESEIREKIAELEAELSDLQFGTEIAEAGNGSFIETGKRYFKCDCGCQNRVGKSEWREYLAGEPLEITCSACGVVGTVRNAKEESESKADGLGLHALEKVWR